MTPQYPPFTDESESDEWTYTTAARVACGSCGEWVYPRRKGDSGPFALPTTCPVCGGLLSESVTPPVRTEPVHPRTREEAIRLLRERAGLGRRAGFGGDFYALPESVQAALYGIAGQLEYIADFLEDSP